MEIVEGARDIQYRVHSSVAMLPEEHEQSSSLALQKPGVHAILFWL